MLLYRFGLREGSGGEGEFRGGEGVVRELEFMHQLQVSILSEVGFVRLIELCMCDLGVTHKLVGWFTIETISSAIWP